MVELIKQQRHFLLLIVQTSPAQRKALLRTITRNQLRALSQIAHNIIKSNIRLTPAERQHLKRHRRLIYILGDRKLGSHHKKEAIIGKQKLIHALVKIALAYLEPVLQ